MVSQTGPRVVRSNSCKGPVYPGKGPKKSQRDKQKFWGQQVLFGANYLKFGPRRANLATLVIVSSGLGMCDRLNSLVCNDILNSQWRHPHSGVYVKELNTVWLI